MAGILPEATQVSIVRVVTLRVLANSRLVSSCGVYSDAEREFLSISVGMGETNRMQPAESKSEYRKYRAPISESLLISERKESDQVFLRQKEVESDRFV